ncbi:MAG: hypothetical protein ACRBK7_11145 [Acidimicrobiales bacterium]
MRHRVRTITDGAIELSNEQVQSSAASVAGAVVDGRAFFQTDDERGLGPALRWARSQGAERLTLIAEADVASDLARRAGLLDVAVDVWSATGAEVEPATESPILRPPELPTDELRFASVISEAGARALDDHGMLIAEIAGLEVARVVTEEPVAGEIISGEAVPGESDADDGPAGGEPADRPVSGYLPVDDGPHLSVGVGQADRELQQYIHGHLDDDTNLRRAIAAVVRERRPGVGSHPLARVARQRWLRAIALDDPALLGLSALEAVTPLRPRHTVLGDEPAVAIGHDDQGNTSVVAFSVGVDLDLLPEAADYRHRDAPDARLVIVLPERDRKLATTGAADWLPGVVITSIDVPWESLA